jgi:RNA polymerase sigma factor (sigma-70 family)
LRPLILGEGVIDDAADIADMIARTALNDRAAFRRLYNVSSSKLFAVALRILKDRTEAEDALQDIYVKIWNRADRFAGDGTSPMGWLVAVARNHSIDRLRARRTGHSDIDKHADIADPGRSPESEAIAASERRASTAASSSWKRQRPIRYAPPIWTAIRTRNWRTGMRFRSTRCEPGCGAA